MPPRRSPPTAQRARERALSEALYKDQKQLDQIGMFVSLIAYSLGFNRGKLSSENFQDGLKVIVTIGTFFLVLVWLRYSSLRHYMRYRTTTIVSLAIIYNAIQFSRTDDIDFLPFSFEMADTNTNRLQSAVSQLYRFLAAMRIIQLALSPFLVPLPLIWEFMLAPLRLLVFRSVAELCSSRLISTGLTEQREENILQFDWLMHGFPNARKFLFR